MTAEVVDRLSDHENPERQAPDRLARRTGTGPFRGLIGLTLAELKRWFPARVLVLAVVASAAVGTVFLIWSSGPNAASPRLGAYVYPAFAIWTVLMMLAVVATTQGAMADEIEEGTAAWVVAKPVGRPGFVLAKFLAAVPGVLIGAILIPGIVLRLLIVAAEGRGDTAFSATDVLRLLEPDGSARVEYMTLPPVERHAGGLALLAVVLLFVVAVMLLLGCAVRSRAAVFLLGLAVPIGLLVSALIGSGAVVELTPVWAFDALLEAIRNESAPLLGPTVITGAWTAGLVIIAMVWFSRMELR